MQQLKCATVVSSFMYCMCVCVRFQGRLNETKLRLQVLEIPVWYIFSSQWTRSSTHQHDDTPVEDSSVVAVATG